MVKKNKKDRLNMKSFVNTILIAFLLLALVGCKSNKKEVVKEVAVSTDTGLKFLSKEEAENKIVVDEIEDFFGSLSIADMSIQLRKTDMPESGGESKVLYQTLLRNEMSEFKPEEKAFMQEVFISAKSAIDYLNPKLYPEHIELLKTKTNHYGPDVYYTREDAIILPENIFEAPSVKVQMPIMLHEIFHILSRYNDDFRDKMYALIGFEKFEEDLVIPKYLQDRLLTNPDGIRRDYAINLKNDQGEIQRAVPLILTKRERYDESMPTFFSYLNFDLFPLIKITENQVTLGLKNKGESSLSLEHNADFFNLIKDNTQYIIHPDEILADNFMMAVIAHRDNDYSGFSNDGKKLLMDVIDVLKSFE
ncbi:MAG: hypothetical protein ACJA1A_003096 [Saprospiraceae bacterium]|jgi:hypothetical protein